MKSGTVYGSYNAINGGVIVTGATTNVRFRAILTIMQNATPIGHLGNSEDTRDTI